MNEERFAQLEKSEDVKMEMLKNLTFSFNELKDKVNGYLDGRVQRQQEAEKRMDERFEAMWVRCEKYFAGKPTEWIVYTAVSAFGLLIIGALGVLLFPHKASAFAMIILNLSN